MSNKEIFFHNQLLGRTACLRNPPDAASILNVSLGGNILLEVGIARLNPKDKQYIKATGREEALKKIKGRIYNLCSYRISEDEKIAVFSNEEVSVHFKIKNSRVYLTGVFLHADS